MWSFVVTVHSLSCVRLFAACGLQHTRLSCPSLSPRVVCSNSYPVTNHLMLCCPLLLLPSVFPGIRVFSVELALHIRWPKYWNFSICIPMNIKEWFPLDWLVWSPCCSRDSQKSSLAPQFESINSLALSLTYGSILTSIYDCWKNHP